MCLTEDECLDPCTHMPIAIELPLLLCHLLPVKPPELNINNLTQVPHAKNSSGLKVKKFLDLIQLKL